MPMTSREHIEKEGVLESGRRREERGREESHPRGNDHFCKAEKSPNDPRSSSPMRLRDMIAPERNMQHSREVRKKLRASPQKAWWDSWARPITKLETAGRNVTAR